MDFVKAFLEADIPLHKLRHPSLKSLFERRKIDHPSETSCRNAVNQLHQIQIEKLKEHLVGADITVMCDEAFINNSKIVHVLIGAVGEKLSLVSSTSVEQCNSSTICQAVDDAIKNYTLVERTCCTLPQTLHIIWSKMAIH